MLLETLLKYQILPLLCCFLTACSQTPLPQKDLKTHIQQAGFAPDEVSVLMQPLFSGADPVSHRADAAMAPASTMKVLTSTVALARLGTDWRGFTRLALAAGDFEKLQQQAHVQGLSFRLQQPLFLQAGSDADLNDAELRSLLQQLRALGVTELGGGIVLDRSVFTPARTDVGAADFDESPKARYNHQPDALYLGQSQTVLRLSANYHQLQAMVLPYWPGVQLDVSAVQLTEQSCDDVKLANLTASLHPALSKSTVASAQLQSKTPRSTQPVQQRWILKLAGQFAKNCQQQGSFELIDRDLSLMLSLEQEWLALGGKLGSQLEGQFEGQLGGQSGVKTGQNTSAPSGAAATPLLPDVSALISGIPQSNWLKTGVSPADAVPVAIHASRPLAELVLRVNKSSDNALTRLLFLTLGAEAKGAETESSQTKNADTTGAVISASAQPQQRTLQPGAATLITHQLAQQQVKQWLTEQNINSDVLVLENGSGLSRTERVSATLLAEVLKTAWLAPYGPELLASLPLSGTDGTLKNRFKSGPAYQKARLKTGTLRDVTALAGFVWDGQNRPWVVVMMVNSDKAMKAGRPLLDKLVQQLAGSGGGKH